MGVDITGPLPMGKCQIKFKIVTIDYLTKWIKVKPLITITKNKTTSFIKKILIYQYELPHIIVTDNVKCLIMLVLENSQLTWASLMHYFHQLTLKLTIK